MMGRDGEQVEVISPRATGFTVLCHACAAEIGQPGWSGATFTGRLDLDLQSGVFLCRHGHVVRVERARRAGRSISTEAA
jgi:hypothetical protein